MILAVHFFDVVSLIKTSNSFYNTSGYFSLYIVQNRFIILLLRFL
jgi:hypothetical protein